MAIPIKETPVLNGHQALKFLTDVKKNQKNRRPHIASCRRAIELCTKMKAKYSFVF